MRNTRRENPVRRRHLGGFTFVELLATVALLGIVMPVAMQTIGLCTRLAGQSRQRMEAAALASIKMTELLAAGDWETGARSGEFTDWAAYRWTLDVANWTESTVRQIDVTIHWQSQGRQRQFVLSTLVYPEES
ncbi:MAG: prepilin-type N-terminal cleavage/methylation domain-containing protein [Sedimentisphaerales bacterium]|nr:prepilin-type N-terminal cleavage/methylation domain-containing protein [Sedimentisphaerales bacterium]